MSRLIPAALFLIACAPVLAQNYDPPPAKTPDAPTLKKIEEQTAKLKEAVSHAAGKLLPSQRAELEIYPKAAEWIVRHQEWYTVDSAKQTLAVIEQGLKRANEVNEGKTPWLDQPGRVVARGFRSLIDDSVQPYAVSYPHGYGEDKTKKWRLDIVLHGRDSSLTEVKFLAQHDGMKVVPKDQDFIQLDVYGRGNNGYRWAGDTDITEAYIFFAKSALRRQDGDYFLPIDSHKKVLKGFSMGGAGTWHHGLRRASFAVLQPGAGFTSTHGYVGMLPKALPDHQESCLRIYDAYLYAENAFNVPVVAYSGENDKQRQAALIMEEELAKLKLSDQMTHLVGPGLEHKFPPEWQRKAEELIRKRLNEGGRQEFPPRIRFVTYTLKQPGWNWVSIEGMEKHYERAAVDAVWDGTSFRVTTTNATRLQLEAPPGKPFPTTVTLDSEVVTCKTRNSRNDFVRDKQGWRLHTSDPKEVRTDKRPGVQGPIDDAFTGQFLCVLGTGTPNNAEMHKAAVAQLDRFRREWDKYLRGELPVKKDLEVTGADLETKNLILFGDPGSNVLITASLPKVPIRWTKDALEVGDMKYDAMSHLPMLIQPSPFAGNRYIVLNSGHTFHEADFKGTNALLYPRLGDYAVVKPTPTDKDPAAFEVVTAGLFDEAWQFPKN